MATVWDVTEGFDPQVAYTQQTRVRPTAKVSCFSVIAIAVGAMFSAPETHILTVEGWASLPVISVCAVPRTGGVPKKPVRRQRDQYAPDARDGLSTHRLAQTFSSVFTPVANEDSVGIDFSFG
jgi:hypothetical protein